MKQHVYKIEDSDINHILNEFSIDLDSIPSLVISALFNKLPEVSNKCFKAKLTNNLTIMYGKTRRFRRLEIALNKLTDNWINNK